MGQLRQQVGSITPSHLFAANDVTVIIKSATLKSGQGIVKRGTVLGKVTADGLAVPVDSTKSDGSQLPYAVLVDDVDTTGGNESAEVYVTGHFNGRALIFGGTDTVATHQTELRKLGIFIGDVNPY